MVKSCFKLRQSRIALLFQLCIFALLMFVLYQVLPVALWVVCFLIGIVIYALFYKKTPHIAQLEHLDGREWSLTQQQATQRVQLSHVVDHQAYIVLYFQHARAKPLLVWCDQVPLKQWKSLKVLAKMI